MRRIAPRVRLATALCGVAALVAAQGPAAGAPKGPVYVNFHAPAEQARNAAEPTIGVNWKTNAVLYQAHTQTYRVEFDDKSKTSEWIEVTAPAEGMITLDPILHTDPVTGRTFVSQLLGACSLLSYTDNDGETWMPSQGCGPGALFDHQSVASGPYASPAPPLRSPVLTYPHAVYYCSQAVVEAACARSDDGGVTFGPAVPMYTIAQCEGLHGHMRIARDGTVYVPHFGCGDRQGVVVSEDNGLTWEVRTVPGSTSGYESDASVGIGAGGRVYLGYQDGAPGRDTKAMVAVSGDKGRTWNHVTDVGRAFGIRNVQFPVVVAGDDDRAAIAFLGTKQGGDDQAAGFGGVWHLYVATTYDGGRTWKTVDATPKEIVQRGCIWLGGGANPCRNLLDFNGIAVDRVGRVLVSWADGCTGSCEGPGGRSTYEDRGVITRQVAGRTLFRKYDRQFG